MKTQEYWEEKYKNQKLKVQELIRREMTKYEEKVINEIEENKDTKKIFKMIDKLRGKEGEKRKEIVIMNADNSKISTDKIPQKMKQYWGSVYRRYKNTIEEEWNVVQCEKYSI